MVDDTTSWVRIESVPQMQADGSSVWQGVMSDISQAKQREFDLQRSLDDAPIAIVSLDLRDKDPAITYVNRAFERSFGHTPLTIPRQSVWAELSFPDPAYRAALMERWWLALSRLQQEGGSRGEPEQLRVRAADGRDMDVLGTWVVIGDTLLISLLDISARLLAERQLREARSALAETALAITQAIPVGTYTMLLPPEREIASFNFVSDRFLEITGLERDAVQIGRAHV